MSTPQNPSSCCSTTEVVNVPGSAGLNNHAVTTATFAIPAIGAQVVVSVVNNQMLQVGLPVFVGDSAGIFGTFQVFALPGGISTSVVLTYVGSALDSPVGSAILAGAKIIPTGIGQVFANPLTLLLGGTGVAVATYPLLRSAIFETDFDALTNFTDNTTGAATSTLAAGVGISTLVFYVPLVSISAAAFATFTPGYSHKILSISASVITAATTAAKLATVTPYINGVSVTGGALALTSANCTPIGATVSGSAITGLNTGTAAQTVALVGSTVTAFVEGAVLIFVRIQNMDTADAFASIAAKINTLQTGVGP